MSIRVNIDRSPSPSDLTFDSCVEDTRDVINEEGVFVGLRTTSSAELSQGCSRGVAEYVLVINGLLAKGNYDIVRSAGDLSA